MWNPSVWYGEANGFPGPTPRGLQPSSAPTFMDRDSQSLVSPETAYPHPVSGSITPALVCPPDGPKGSQLPSPSVFTPVQAVLPHFCPLWGMWAWSGFPHWFPRDFQARLVPMGGGNPTSWSVVFFCLTASLSTDRLTTAVVTLTASPPVSTLHPTKNPEIATVLAWIGIQVPV